MKSLRREAPVKKLIIVFVMIALILLVGSVFTTVYAQDAAKDDTPTFYHLTPGTYVNGWPRFTVHYPKDWVQALAMTQEVFRAVPPGNTGDVFAILVYANRQPLDKVVDAVAGYFKGAGVKDLTVVKDKPTQLSNGTPAREVEIRGIWNGSPFSFACLCVKHGDLWIQPEVSSQSARIGEHLAAILYSLQYKPSKDEPVKVPADVQEFLDGQCRDLLSHDLAKVMTRFSDKFLNLGVRKGEVERTVRSWIGSVTSCEVRVTDFIAEGDRAYLAGFNIGGWGKAPLLGTSIIKESGEWKWYGNQRDVVP